MKETLALCVAVVLQMLVIVWQSMRLTELTDKCQRGANQRGANKHTLGLACYNCSCVEGP